MDNNQIAIIMDRDTAHELDALCVYLGALATKFIPTPEHQAIFTEYVEAYTMATTQPQINNNWQPISTAPKTDSKTMRAIPFEGWCPDPNATNGGDIKIIWWEPRLKGGQWYSDGDMQEHPTLWRPLRPIPSENESKLR